MPFDPISFAMGAKSSGGGGSSGLPAVTAEDNGDVLTVVDGAWGKAAPSGGGGVLAVNVTEDPDTPDLYVCDKTAGEMYAADIIVLVYDFGNGYGKKSTILEFRFINTLVEDAYIFEDYNGNAFVAKSASDYPTCDQS